MFVLIFLYFLLPTHLCQFSELDIPELDYMDTTIDPCTDFYQFTCGNFRKVHSQVPDEGETVDNFMLLTEQLLDVGNDILSSPAECTDPRALKQIKNAYQSCISQPHIAANPAPELRLIDKFNDLPILHSSPSAHQQEITWAQIGDLVGQTGVPIFFKYQPIQFSIEDFNLYMRKNQFDESNLQKSSIPFKIQKSYDQILMEEIENAKSIDVKLSGRSSQALRTLFQRIVVYLIEAKQLPERSPDEISRDIDDLMSFVKNSDGIVEENAEITKLSMPLTPPKLQQWTETQFGADFSAKFNWLEYFRQHFKRSGLNVTDDFQIYCEPSLIPTTLYGILNLFRKFDAATIKNYVLLHTLIFLAPDSDPRIQSMFEDYLRQLNHPVQPREVYCTKKYLDVDGNGIGLNYAALYAFTQYNFDWNRINSATELLQSIGSTLQKTIENSQWMDAETGQAALKKLNKMISIIGWPDFVNESHTLDEFYENLPVCMWDHWSNAMNLRAYQKAYDLSRIVVQRRDFWTNSGFEVNAYYNSNNNKIIVPVSILYNLFFNGSNPLIDFSRLGTILSHEITHGFDEKGRTFDENGASQVGMGWWTEETNKIYANKSKCFVEQYGKYYVQEVGKYVNGTKTLDENIADNGGFVEAWKTFKSYVAANGVTSVSEKYTLDQLFFIGFGTMWCSNESATYLEALLQQNGHTPSRFRVNGMVSNSAAFAEAFNCPAQSAMNPEIKCSLW